MPDATTATLDDWLQGSAYQGYAYSYPHKQAYRPLEEPVPLAPLWHRENREALFLYAHIPFCEMRCGFCNLFTTTNPEGDLVGRYLDSLAREAEAAAAFLGPHRFSRGAIGGGTPSFLEEAELARLFAILRDTLGGLPSGMPLSFETSPATVSAGKLALLRELGVTRLSIGVQSFIEEETRQLGRPQQAPLVEAALGMIREAGFPVFNLDLIYGVAGQTRQSWDYSLRRTLEFAPEEVYLYPLYVRPLTGLDRIGREASDQRPALYRQAREMLLAAGYRQVSMRLFRKTNMESDPNQTEGPVYCCQEDGMLGLGAGARSYTAALHYSTEYAVGRSGINEIIGSYASRTPDEHSRATYGCPLPPEEQRRRHVIKSLLRVPGLEFSHYENCFGSSATDDFPELRQLLDHGLATLGPTHLALTATGFGQSDTIGPWLASPGVAERMEGYELR